MRCSNCKKKLGNTDTFCPNCGTPVGKKKLGNKWFRILLIVLAVEILCVGIIAVLLLRGGNNKKTDNSNKNESISFSDSINGVFFGEDESDEEVIVIKDNVSVITYETEKDFQPISVSEDEIIFLKNPKYAYGQIIVSGVTESAPAGFIRRVLSTEREDGTYVVKTENALLTDVFEEAHISRTFALYEDTVEEVVGGITTTSSNANFYTPMPMAFISAIPSVSYDKQFKIFGNINEDDEYAFEESFEYTIARSVTLSGSFGFDGWIEVDIDIVDDNIIWTMALYTITGGNIYVGSYMEITTEIEEVLFDCPLPSIQFMAGFVPIVITNELQIGLEGDTTISGEIGSSYEIKSENVCGFSYSSSDKQLTDISDRTYLSDGMDWETQARVDVENNVGVALELASKLYDSTGAEFGLGIKGEMVGNLTAIPVNNSFENCDYIGNLDMAIVPYLQGEIVVTIPIIDRYLGEFTLFEEELEPLWSMHWENSTISNTYMDKSENDYNENTDVSSMEYDAIFQLLRSGDFSIFAGEYIATTEDNDAYGGGETLNPLTLHNDGSISGGVNFADLYPENPPISVTKNPDGSYLCQLTEFCHYTIFPKNVIEDREYVKEHQSYLRDTVYITCFYFDGGVMMPTYYKLYETQEETTAQVTEPVLEDGVVDWVSIDDFSEEIGSMFVSGKGQTYYVMAEEVNNDAGRTRCILMSEDGNKAMITALPAFKIDATTGISYFEILNYIENPNYVEYRSIND